MATASPKRATRKVEYPTSDGKPMAETEKHRKLMNYSIDVLDFRYADESDVHVSGNLLLYYEKGNKRKHLAPDVFVVWGVPKRERLYYLLWEEGVSPQVVIEMTSKTTKREDLGKKKVLYRDTLKVEEYFLFDPFGDYLNPPLQGFRLRDGDYIRIEPDANGRLYSERLGLCLERVGTELRYFDPATGQYAPTRLEAEAMARQRVEEENERLRQEIEALRRQTPTP